MTTPGRHPSTTGPLALVGGEEFQPGNEPQDRLLLERSAETRPGGRVLIVASAAARQGPDHAVETATAWFRSLGADAEELRLRTRGEAQSAAAAETARTGRLFYLTGGDPGLTVELLAGTPAWAAILEAWHAGAVLAGSSAGAMALGEWTLIRARTPGDGHRRPKLALGLLDRVAVLPHFDRFGRGWIGSAQEALAGEHPVLVGVDERGAAVWDGGEWRAMGRGGVTVIKGARERRFDAGERIEGLPLP